MGWSISDRLPEGYAARNWLRCGLIGACMLRLLVTGATAVRTRNIATASTNPSGCRQIQTSCSNVAAWSASTFWVHGWLSGGNGRIKRYCPKGGCVHAVWRRQVAVRSASDREVG